MASATAASAQKKITPVDTDPTKPPQPVLHYYDKHGNPLEEPVLFLADLDTVTNVKSVACVSSFAVGEHRCEFF